jgi:hypothetical protein
MKKKKIDPMGRKVYRLWFEFLRLSNRANWAGHVEERFGDVWATDFETWWETHEYLFEKLDPFTVKVVEDVTEFRWFNDDADGDASVQADGGETEDPDVIVIAVNLLESKLALQKAFDDLLKKYHPKTTGSPKFEDLTWYYNLDSRPSVPTLQTTLDVFNYQRKNPEMSSLEIEEKLNLIPKTGEDAAPLWKEVGAPETIAKRKRLQKSTVDRYLERAQCLIKNVEQGIFPKND